MKVADIKREDLQKDSYYKVLNKSGKITTVIYVAMRNYITSIHSENHYTFGKFIHYFQDCEIVPLG